MGRTDHDPLAAMIIARATASLAAAMILSFGPAAAQTYRAIDADTVELPDGRILRIENQDSPETRIYSPINPNRGAQCPAEKARGLQGKRYAQSVLDRGQARPILPTPLRYDRWGRLLGQLEIDGADYAIIMTSAGYMRPYPYSGCGRACKPNWCTELRERQALPEHTQRQQ